MLDMLVFVDSMIFFAKNGLTRSEPTKVRIGHPKCNTCIGTLLSFPHSETTELITAIKNILKNFQNKAFWMGGFKDHS